MPRDDDLRFDPDAPLGPKFWSTGPVDDRRRVRDASIRPLNSICRLIAPGPLLGSGTVIARRAILTAGHNLQGVAHTRWHIDQGFNQTPQYYPLKGAREFPHPRWSGARDPNFDIGLVALAEDAPTSFPSSVVSEDDADASIYVCGYSLDDPNFQRFDVGSLTNAEGNVAGHTCDTAPGQSGSPVLAYDNNSTRLIGVHVYGYAELDDLFPGPVNKAVLLVPEIVEWIDGILQGSEN
ncbi:trypsin-like serine peptidase [Altererythrobacter sp. Root672]|uniref:trypsin-like serine peptidase n=1 Tax=Altererythrobacter sp. Root672 TaxID=1736584 RepID=UPI000A6C872B|nr:trypsin-like peptidase domain-containing protein [Altererythrobacter sp. Root672]